MDEFRSSLEIERTFACSKQDGMVVLTFAAMVNLSRVTMEEEHAGTVATDEELVGATIGAACKSAPVGIHTS